MSPADDMCERIRSFADKTHGAGATPDEIAQAERTLQVVLPQSYRRFLREFGWADIGCDLLYGLGADAPAYLKLTRNTLSERNEMHPPMPMRLIPVMNDGAGNHYCLDTGAMRQGECPVVFWNHELPADQEPEVVAPSFDAWIVQMLDDMD